MLLEIRFLRKLEDGGHLYPCIKYYADGSGDVLAIDDNGGEYQLHHFECINELHDYLIFK